MEGENSKQTLDKSFSLQESRKKTQDPKVKKENEKQAKKKVKQEVCLTKASLVLIFSVFLLQQVLNHRE